MVIIKTSYLLHPDQARKLQQEFACQAATGALLLPANFEVVAEVPDGEEIRVEPKTDSEKMDAALHRQDLRYVAEKVPTVLRRLDAAVFTVIDPCLAKEAANVIRLQHELLGGKRL